MADHKNQTGEPVAESVEVHFWSLAQQLTLLDEKASGRERIDRMTIAEKMKNCLAAMQAGDAHALLTARLDALAVADRTGKQELADARRSVAAEIGLARHISPHTGRALLEAAETIIAHQPHTFAAMVRGDLTEHRAGEIVRGLDCLSPADRRKADAELAPELAQLGNRTSRDAAAGIAARLDQQAVVDRIKKANQQRRVTVRPAGDGTVWLTALLPTASGLSCFKALLDHANFAVDGGPARSRDQAMADELVTRLTGASTRVDELGVPLSGRIELNLVMTDKSLFGLDDEPAEMPGYGPVPAQLARRVIACGAEHEVRVFLRRLYTDPGTHRLTAMDSRGRYFPANANRFLVLRDQHCRMPWCDAPIADGDHVHDHAKGGPTDLRNGQGLSKNCNHVKSLPGWAARVEGDTIVTTTPTGSEYRSWSPQLPVSPPWERDVEADLDSILDNALADPTAETPPPETNPGSFGIIRYISIGELAAWQRAINQEPALA